MSAKYLKTSTDKNTVASLIRHLLLAWLTAAAGEFLLLPAQAKTMYGLQALAAMSLPRLLIVAGVVLAILEGTSRFFDGKMNRWLLPGIFLVLASAAVARAMAAISPFPAAM